MRRLAVAIAILALTFSSRASADPFANLSHSLEVYDQPSQEQPAGRQAARPRQSSGRGNSANRASGGAINRGTMARQAQATQPAAPMPEEVEPVPMSQQQFEDPMDGYYPGDVWEEPMGDCSGGSCGMGCGWCQPGFWGRAEYLAWSVRGASIPALVTTSPVGTPVGVAGRLPNATVLFGDERINDRMRSGGRFTLGYWCDPCNQLGIENTFFFIGGQSEGYSNSSSGSPILARPFLNTDNQEQDAVLLAFPNIVAGGINITSSRTVYSNEINLRRALYSDCCRRLDVLAGYRYFRLGETLDASTNQTAIEGGEQILALDQFNTGNNFNGGQLGLNWQFTRGCWTWDILGKLALGGVSQRAVISGSTTTIVNDQTNNFDGGLLALASNSGQHDQTVFGVLPEFDINLRYQWSPLWRVNIGYTFMALTNVLRPGDQISLNIDQDQIPPAQGLGTFPAFAFNSSDIWLQGINFGIECNF